MQIKKDYMLSLDVQPNDVVFQYTTVTLTPHSPYFSV